MASALLGPLCFLLATVSYASCSQQTQGLPLELSDYRSLFGLNASNDRHDQKIGLTPRSSEKTCENLQILFVEPGKNVTLTSLNYPDNYPALYGCGYMFLGCFWRRVSVDCSIEVKLNDSVFLWSPSKSKVFTNTTVSYAAQMDMNIVFIGFISDFLEQGKGFKCTISG